MSAGDDWVEEAMLGKIRFTRWMTKLGRRCQATEVPRPLDNDKIELCSCLGDRLVGEYAILMKIGIVEMCRLEVQGRRCVVEVGEDEEAGSL